MLRLVSMLIHRSHSISGQLFSIPVRIPHECCWTCDLIRATGIQMYTTTSSISSAVFETVSKAVNSWYCILTQLSIYSSHARLVTLQFRATLRVVSNSPDWDASGIVWKKAYKRSRCPICGWCWIRCQKVTQQISKTQRSAAGSSELCEPADDSPNL